MSEIVCPKCGSKTYRVPEKMGWRITADGIFSFPEADFCVSCEWKCRVAGSAKELKL